MINPSKHFKLEQIGVILNFNGKSFDYIGSYNHSNSTLKRKEPQKASNSNKQFCKNIKDNFYHIGSYDNKLTTILLH